MNGRVFISYKREDSAGFALALYNKLCESFGKGAIFMDVDAIEPGLDFVDVIEQAVGSCDALIALMGQGWVVSRGPAALDPTGPSDFVRLEIATALRRDIRVIPVLLNGRKMPVTDELPEDLLPLLRRNAVELSTTRFNADVDRLIETLRKIIQLEPSAVPQSAQTVRAVAAGDTPTPAGSGGSGVASDSGPPVIAVSLQGTPDDQVLAATMLDLPAPARLERRQPAERSESIALDRVSYLLGRLRACDIMLYSPTASREHARIIARSSTWYLQPLPDKVVLADGVRIGGETPLRHRMRLQLGADEFIFIDERAAEGLADQPARNPSQSRTLRLLYAVATLGALAAIVWLAVSR